MRYQDSYASGPVPPTHVLEIRLGQERWSIIKEIAEVKNRSYSWVVRYAVFRLIKRNNPERYTRQILNIGDGAGSDLNDNLSEIDKRVREQRFGSRLKHRHRLCLYGEDELFIRISAAKLGCTMTHLVRLALEKHLDLMLDRFTKSSVIGGGRVPDAFWYWLGIKIHHDVEFPIKSLSKQYFNFKRFQKRQYF